MGLDLILYWKICNYWKIILLNLKMPLCAWWPIFFAITKDSIIQNLFQKLSIFETECSSSEIWDCQWHKTFCNTSFYCLDLVAFFQIIKICQCCGFTFTNFFLFLTATNVFRASWVSFSNTRLFFCIFPILTER